MQSSICHKDSYSFLKYQKRFLFTKKLRIPFISISIKIKIKLRKNKTLVIHIKN